MSTEQSDQPNGLSSEIWEQLQRGENWGKMATDLQKLDKMKQFKKPFVHERMFIADGPMSRNDGYNNPKMHLEDARYGPIEGVAASKPSVWLIIRHEKEPNGQSQISEWALFRAWIVTFACTRAGEVMAEVIVNPDIPVVVHSTVVVIGSDTYALLCMHAENDEKGKLYPWCATTLGDEETLVVQVVNNRPAMQHQRAVWVTPDPREPE